MPPSATLASCRWRLSCCGSVPELLFKNLGEQPVLLVEGEELVGATFAGLDLFAHEATRRPGR